MLHAILAAILVIGFFGPIYADEFNAVRWEAQAAFAELDSEVAELEAQRRSATTGTKMAPSIA